MRHTLPCSFPLLLALAAPALEAQTETSPKGYLTTEAGSSLSDLGAYGKNTNASTFFRQVDATLLGNQRALAVLHLRRDGAGATNSTSLARTVAFSVRLAYADWAKVLNATPQADVEWLSGSWSQALTDKVVSLPDLRTQPAATPAPWSITLPLDVPFQYSGQKALAFDIKAGPSNLGTTEYYALDRHWVPAFTRNTSTAVGVGCLATGRPAKMTHTASLSHHGEGSLPGLFAMDLLNGIPSAACWALLGTKSQNVNLGLCTSLFTSAEVVVPANPINSNGYGQIFFHFTVPAGLIGQKLHSQFVIQDAGQPVIPIALSNGATTTMPGLPGPLQKLVASGYTSLAVSGWMATQTLSKDTGLVIGL